MLQAERHCCGIPPTALGIGSSKFQTCIESQPISCIPNGGSSRYYSDPQGDRTKYMGDAFNKPQGITHDTSENGIDSSTSRNTTTPGHSGSVNYSTAVAGNRQGNSLTHTAYSTITNQGRRRSIASSGTLPSN